MASSAMALPARTGMRLLSRRLQDLQRSPTLGATFLTSQQRLQSRYSKPSKRSDAVTATTSSEYVPDFSAAQGSAQASLSHTDPLLRLNIRRDKARRQAALKRRFRFSAIGAVVGMVCIALTAAQLNREVNKKQTLKLDSSKADGERFQGKEVHVIGLGEGKRIVAEDESGAIDLVETGTSSVPHFPKVMYLPTATESDATDPNAIAVPNSQANPGNRAGMEEYTLLGLGIRSVSFLGIQVYVMGMYVRTTDLTSLQARLIHSVNPNASTLIPSEKEDLRARLVDGEASSLFWQELLKTPGLKTAWRIAPTRNTDFMHLRDGWITGINKRTAEAKKKNGNVPSEYDREDFGMSVRSFMSIFKGGKAPKGSVMILARTADGGMDVYFAAKPGAGAEQNETQLLGSIGDERISKLIWLNYLAGDKVSSEPARRGVVDGCVTLAGRPVGSAETMVA